ncbi:MAG TPA: hypothetical protein VN965_06575 [Candidatus Dormibacteraeota bacterium]|nr:hypothetical protein [Candidatus Dormibacteraeota bacterium]
MDDDQVAVVILDSKNFDRNSGLIIPENQQPIWLCRIVLRCLYVSQTAMDETP